MSQSRENDPIAPSRLSLDDRRVLDALVEGEFGRNVERGLNDRDRDRARGLRALFGLLEDYPVDDGDEALVQATLARVAAARGESTEARGLRLVGSGEPAARPARRFRVPDFISIAAAFLILASVAWPLLSAMRHRAIDRTCASNLQTMGAAFATYANDHDDRVPMVMAGFSSAARLLDPLPLVRQGYCDHGHVNCPGRHMPNQPGYSCQVLLPADGREPSWSAGVLPVILGDRNPILDARRAASQLPPMSNSINHDGRGQNILFRDLSVRWLDRPTIDGGDNIWTVGETDEFDPGTLPAVVDDAFLVH